MARVTSRRKHNSDIIVTAFRKHSHIVHIAMFTAARRKNRYILHIAMFTATCYTSELQRFDCIKVLDSYTYLFYLRAQKQKMAIFDIK